MRLGSVMRSALVAGLLTLALPSPALAIQGGQRDVDNTFANVAILRFVDSDGTYPTDRWRCTGTLVAPDVIITAAHCTEAPVDTVYYSFDWQGPLGEPDAKAGIPAELANDPGWTLAGTNADGTQNIFTDPDWSGDLQLQSLDDIGIIVLDTPVTGIEPAEIAPSATSPAPRAARCSPWPATASATPSRCRARRSRWKPPTGSGGSPSRRCRTSPATRSCWPRTRRIAAVAAARASATPAARCSSTACSSG